MEGYPFLRRGPSFRADLGRRITGLAPSPKRVPCVLSWARAAVTTDSSQFSLVRGQYHRRKSGRNVHRSDGVLALSSIILRKYLISNRPSLT